MRVHVRPALLAAIALATAIGVAACGGGGASGSSTASTTGAAAAATADASSTPGGNAGRANPFADPSIQACLKAAGIAVPTFARPTGSFTRRPSGSFTRPSGSFTRARPTGSSSRPAGGFGGFGGTNAPDFQKIQQALTACGLSLPTGARGFGGGGGGGGAPQPSAAPSA